jgi:hypothetical protein
MTDSLAPHAQLSAHRAFILKAINQAMSRLHATRTRTRALPENHETEKRAQRLGTPWVAYMQGWRRISHSVTELVL